ncbi:MAG TPA: toll/interleukin-1 receptor domain-containing protein [Longimicrobiaceae bacterium]|nr:toll/interleukin-1 receptor domain-containing protein [Longimicrobiaceae bacterium]
MFILSAAFRLHHPYLAKVELIVRLSELSPHRQWWRYGIDIKAQDSAWTGSVVAPPGGNVLRIHVAAPESSQRQEQQRKAAASLLSLVERTLPGANPTIAASADGEVFVDLDRLTQAREDGRSHCIDLEGIAWPVERFARLPSRTDLARSDREDLYPEAPAMKTATSKLKIFISYAHKDEAYKDELRNRLKIIGRSCPIEYWDDRELFAGTLVDEEIFERLNAADITCLLISSDFVASDYCWTREMASALEQYERHGKLPVPIIVRRTPSWQDEKIGKHVALPKDGKPLSDWRTQDDFWADVEEGLRRLIKRELERKGVSAPS